MTTSLYICGTEPHSVLTWVDPFSRSRFLFNPNILAKALGLYGRQFVHQRLKQKRNIPHILKVEISEIERFNAYVLVSLIKVTSCTYIGNIC